MATHSNILAWKVPWTEEPGGLQPMESQGVGHNWAREKKSRCDFKQAQTQFAIQWTEHEFEGQYRPGSQASSSYFRVTSPSLDMVRWDNALKSNSASNKKVYNKDPLPFLSQTDLRDTCNDTSHWKLKQQICPVNVDFSLSKWDELGIKFSSTCLLN